METLFQSSYIQNKQWAKQFFGYFYFKQKRMIVVHILLGAAALENLFTWLIYGACNTGVLVFVAFFYLLQYLRYHREVNGFIKRCAEMQISDRAIETVVTDECIRSVAADGTVVEIGFDKIKRVYKTKNMIFLRTKAGIYSTFERDGFTKGTADEFLAFLKCKGVK